MIVDESAALRAALDRRLQIDRLLAVDPLRAIADPAGRSVKGAEQDTKQGEGSADGDVAPRPRWSSDALRLQTLAGSTAAATHEGVRFDIPLLVIEAGPVEVKTALADVAHALADAATRDASPPAVRTATETDATPPVFVPLVLHGPAWDGQPMELIVRRERADEMLDNAALDQWCGEVAIDLPELGRVAGHLAFSMQGLRVRLEADDETSVSTLSAASAELAAAFAKIDLRVSGLSVGSPAFDALRSDILAPPSHQSTRAIFMESDRDVA